MDDFLVKDLKIYDLSDKKYNDFKTAGKFHGFAYPLSETCNWKKTYKFYDRQQYRLNEYFWAKNDNYYIHARQFSKWIEDLDIFEYTGSVFAIVNHPG